MCARRLRPEQDVVAYRQYYLVEVHTHSAQVAEVAELDLVCPRLESAELACGAVLASRPAQCPAVTSLVLEQPALALSDVPGLAGMQRLHLGRRCEVRVDAWSMLGGLRACCGCLGFI